MAQMRSELFQERYFMCIFSEPVVACMSEYNAHQDLQMQQYSRAYDCSHAQLHNDCYSHMPCCIAPLQVLLHIVYQHACLSVLVGAAFAFICQQYTVH